MSWIELFEKFGSRKFLIAPVISTVLLVQSLITPSNWVTIIVAYLIAQAAVDVASTVVKHFGAKDDTPQN